MYGYLIVAAETRKPDLGGNFWVMNMTLGLALYDRGDMLFLPMRVSGAWFWRVSWFWFQNARRVSPGKGRNK